MTAKAAAKAFVVLLFTLWREILPLVTACLGLVCSKSTSRRDHTYRTEERPMLPMHFFLRLSLYVNAWALSIEDA